MKRLAFLVALSWSVSLAAAPPSGFDERVETLRNQVGVPGILDLLFTRVAKSK